MYTADFRHTDDLRDRRPGPHEAPYGHDTWTHFLVIAFSVACVTSVAHAQTETIRVDLKLRTGGALSGLVVDHNEHGLVIVHQRTPYVFAWNELEAGNACATRYALLVFERLGQEHLSAEDHLQLGLFALRHGRRDLAANAFRKAKRLDSAYGPIIKEAFDEYRRSETASGIDNDSFVDSAPAETTDGVSKAGLATQVESELAHLSAATLADGPLADHRAEVLDVYKNFGAKVQEVIGKDVVLVESDHFLIWTDFEPRYRDRLASWCEAMYVALCDRLALDRANDVFLAKCPVFCWRSKPRFRAFARQFDGHDAGNAIGYTRSIEQTGHVHVVLLRVGRSEADFDRFACTLVHEGTHAFMHRLYTSRLIPHWVNEGFADLIAERVLEDRCPTGETAELLARQFVRYNWPLGELLHSTGPIEVHQYPLAHSVVAYLEGRDRRRFAGFLKDLKAGKATKDALSANYDGLTLSELEVRWRAAFRVADPEQSPPKDAAPILPWKSEG